jgi:hypothetical protein
MLINAGPQARQQLRWRRRHLANRLGVTVGAIVLALSGAACGHLPGGEISCGQFLDEDIVSQEDIVEKALSENGLSTNNYADLALTTQLSAVTQFLRGSRHVIPQVGSCCCEGSGGLTTACQAVVAPGRFRGR